MQSIECGVKKVVFARFDGGEDLLESLTKCAAKHNILTGVFSLIGGLKVASYGLYENGGYKIVKVESKHCLELLPTFGNITQKEGNTLIHAHITTSDEHKGTAFGGHLMEGCKVYPFAEVTMWELDTIVNRTFDKNLNLWPISF